MCGKEHSLDSLFKSTPSTAFKWMFWPSFIFRWSNAEKWNIEQRVWPSSCCVHLMHLDSLKHIHAKNLANVTVLWHLLGSKHKHTPSLASFALWLKAYSLPVFLLPCLKNYMITKNTSYLKKKSQNTVLREQQNTMCNKKCVLYQSTCRM